jgi:hypothetical protein
MSVAVATQSKSLTKWTSRQVESETADTDKSSRAAPIKIMSVDIAYVCGSGSVYFYFQVSTSCLQVQRRAIGRPGVRDRARIVRYPLAVWASTSSTAILDKYVFGQSITQIGRTKTIAVMLTLALYKLYNETSHTTSTKQRANPLRELKDTKP